VPLLHIINFNNLCFRVENETTLIFAKNRVDLSSISEVRSYITEWPRFLGHPVIFAVLLKFEQLLCTQKQQQLLLLLPPSSWILLFV